MEVKNREYYLKKISKILGILKTKEDLEDIPNVKLLKVKDIFQIEYDFLSDKNNKLDKVRKKYIDNLMKDIDLIDNRIKQYIDNNIENIIKNISENLFEKYGVGDVVLISDYPIKKQIKLKLSSMSIKTQILLFKNIKDNIIATIYSDLINYYTRMISMVTKDMEWDKITNDLIFKDFPENDGIISEKDKTELEFLINHFQKRFPDLYIITDDNLYNEIENDIKGKPELLKEENEEELINLIKKKKEDYVKNNNMIGRLHIEYKN